MNLQSQQVYYFYMSFHQMIYNQDYHLYAALKFYLVRDLTVDHIGLFQRVHQQYLI